MDASGRRRGRGPWTGVVLPMRGCWVLDAGKEERVEAWKRGSVFE